MSTKQTSQPGVRRVSLSVSKPTTDGETEPRPDRMRMKKWLEAKHRRQVADEDSGSVMSVVTSGDDEPRPMDADDSAYHGPARSRIGTIQSYRDAVLSPKRTRHSLVVTDNEGVARAASLGPARAVTSSTRVQDKAKDKQHKAKPLVAYSDDDEEGVAPPVSKQEVKRLVSYSEDDDDGFTVVDHSSSGKRRRAASRRTGVDDSSPLSKRARHDGRRIPSPPPLESDDDLPTMSEIFSSSKAKSSSKRYPEAESPDLSDFKPRRLFRRELDAREDGEMKSLIDDEATLDNVEGVAVSGDEVVPDENEYDCADSFIDDESVANDSDCSMHSAYSRDARKARAGRRAPGGRPSRAASDDDDVPLSDLKKSSTLAPAFNSRPVKSKTRVKREISPKPFPLSSDVLEISSGSERDLDRPAPVALPRPSSPVVKVEPREREEHSKSRPKPRPVSRKARDGATVLPVVVERSSGYKKVAEVDSGDEQEAHVKSNAVTHHTKDKGKGRAVVVDEMKRAESEDLDDDGLHPDERAQLREAIRQSRIATPASRRHGESSSARPASSSVPAPPVTPGPQGRVSIADFIARAIPGQSPSSPLPSAYLEDLHTFHRCRTLPDSCEVYNEDAMDLVLRPVYRGLPNLLAGDLRPWTDLPGKGNMQFSMWADWCPDMSGRVAYDAINFVEVGNIRNPSRVSPLDFVLRSIPQTTNRYNFYCATNPPLPLVATSCVFIDASQLVTASPSGLRQKYIRGNFHCYEWDRFCGFVRTASGFPTLHAQLARDCLQFSTRAASSRSDQGDSQPPPDKKNNKAQARGTRETPAGLFKPSPSRASYNRVSAEPFSLAWDAVVPVYDARSVDSLDFKAVLPRLADSLPLYTGGEIPFGSFAMIGYTMTVYRANNGNYNLGCNLLWAILVGTPHD